MTGPIRIVIADDHVLVLDGMRQALESLPDITVVGIATNGRELLRVLEQVTPDVLLVDIEMPHGTGLAVVRSIDEPPPTLVVTMHADDEHRAEARAAGASGLLSKATRLQDLAAAIRAVDDGAILFSQSQLELALGTYQGARLSPSAESITSRERELLQLMAGGISHTSDIADAMFISQKTVKNHLTNIYVKLDVSDRTQAVVTALRLGVVTESSTPSEIDPLSG